MFLRNGKVGIFDLTSGQVSEEEYEEPTEWDKLSSIDSANRLAEEHGIDSIVLGTGVLTGSFVPASCAGVIRAKPDLDGRPRLMPLLGYAGFELKLSGFDFIVIKGIAREPGYLWVRDGIIEHVKSPKLTSKDSWGRTDAIRQEQGDSKIQVLATGPWGDSKHPQAQLLNSYWGGEDKAGIASEFGKKNLLAVAIRGMGELELAEPEGHFEDAMLLMREHIVKLGANTGLGSYSEAGRRGDFERLTQRHVGCYGCPFPCRTYIKLRSSGEELRTSAEEPGYLHYDVPALERAFGSGLDAASATSAFIACARAGADPWAVLKWASEIDSKISLSVVKQVLADPVDKRYSLIEHVPSNFEASFADGDTYHRCLGLGLCPRYWSKVGFDQLEVASFATNLLGRTFPEDSA